MENEQFLTEETKKDLEEFKSALNAHMKDILGKMDVAGLAKKIIDDHMDQVVPKLLGFENRWGGKWEVDHCNGRSGQTEIGDFIKHQCKGGIIQWLDELKKVKLPKPSKKIKEALKKDYERVFEREIRDTVWHRAKQDAESFINKMIGPIK